MKMVNNPVTKYRIYDPSKFKEHVFSISDNEVRMDIPDLESYFGEQAVEFLDALIDAITGDGGFSSLESITLLNRAMKEAKNILENK